MKKDSQNIDKIEEYIDNIYSNFDTADKDAKILKEEMKIHLYEEVEELKNQGLNKEESINKALEAFGSENSVVAEMNYVLKNRNIFTKILVKAGVVVFILGFLFQIMSIFQNGENIEYFRGGLIKNGFKSISYILYIISLAISDIAFYYYYFTKKQEMVFFAFIFCDFVICIPSLFVCMYFPNRVIGTTVFILITTFIITLFLRIYYVKIKK